MRELGLQNSTLRELGFYRGIGKFDKETPKIDDQRPIIYLHCNFTQVLLSATARLSIYIAPVIALRELGFRLGTTSISAKWQAGLRGLGKIACFGGVKPHKTRSNFLGGFVICIENTFWKKIGPKRLFQPSAVVRPKMTRLYGVAGTN